MIHAIANIEPRGGRRDDFPGDFRKRVPQVLPEDGRMEYGLAVDLATDITAQIPARQEVVTVVEEWEGVEQLK